MPATLFNPDDERSKIAFTFHVLREYLRVSEAALKESEADLSEQFQNIKVTSADEDSTESENLGAKGIEFLHRLVFFRHNLIGKMRYGFVIQLYAAFEAEAISLCKEVNRRDASLSLSVEKIKDWTKLEPLLIEVGVIQEKLDSINRLRLLRNSLAHYNGHFDSSADNQKEAVQKLIDADSGILLAEDGYIEIADRYACCALDLIEGVFEDLFRKYNFGQVYFFTKPHGYGVEILPVKEGYKFRLTERNEVSELRSSDVFKKVVAPQGTPAVTRDQDLEPDPS